MQQIAEYSSINVEKFRNEIAPSNQPAILRGFINDWPAVSKANASDDSICHYIKGFDRKLPASVFFAGPEICGRFWYDENMRGFNFEQRSETLSNILDQLVAHMNDAEPPAIYAGSVAMGQVMPQFIVENTLPMLGNFVEPRIWIGNKTTIQTHYDVSENLACVVAGKRRFTLFPPEQLPNLYVGPLDFNPANAPVSMVQLHDPDFTKYPKFKLALESAYSAELQPGDVIYIPYMWWHHVESLAPINVLVTYWWDRAYPGTGSAFTALMHAVLAVRSLPPDRRAIWKQQFDHYVFETNGDPVSHLDTHARTVLNPMNSNIVAHIKRWLMREITKP